MKYVFATRRSFLATAVTLFASVAAPFRNWFGQRNPLVGTWRIRDYISDGKQVQTKNMDVALSITDNILTIVIRVPGEIPDHVESFRYLIRSSTREIDMDASNDNVFLGVYAQHQRGVTLAWDTIGHGRPETVDDSPRFGLNRMELSRDNAPTQYST